MKFFGTLRAEAIIGLVFALAVGLVKNGVHGEEVSQPVYDWCSNGTYARACKASMDGGPMFASETWDRYKEATYQFVLLETEVLDSTNSRKSRAIKRAQEFYKACISRSKNTNTIKVVKEIKSHMEGIIETSPLFNKNADRTGMNKTHWRQVDWHYVSFDGEPGFFDISWSHRYGSEDPHLVISPLKSFIPPRVLLEFGPRERDYVGGGRFDRTKYNLYMDSLLKEFPAYNKAAKSGVLSERREDIIDLEMRLAWIALPEAVQSPVVKVHGGGAYESRALESTNVYLTVQKFQYWFQKKSQYYDYTFENVWASSALLKLAREMSSEHYDLNPCQIEWVDYIHEIAMRAIKLDNPHLLITDRMLKSVPIVVEHPDYFLKLCVLWNTTAPEVLEDYLHWRFLRKYHVLTPDGEDLHQKLALKLGIREVKELNEDSEYKCTTENLVTEVVQSAVLAEQYSKKKETEGQIREMYNQIIDSVFKKHVMRGFHPKGTVATFEKHINNVEIFTHGDNVEDDPLKDDAPKTPAQSNYYTETLAQKRWRSSLIFRIVTRADNETNQLLTATGRSWPVSPRETGVFIGMTSTNVDLYIPAAMIDLQFFQLDGTREYNYAGLGAEIAASLWTGTTRLEKFHTEVDDYLEKCIIEETYDMGISYPVKESLYTTIHQVFDSVSTAFRSLLKHDDVDPDKRGELMKSFYKQYILNQCEFKDRNDPKSAWPYGMAGGRPILDTIGKRNLNFRYALRDWSTAKFRIHQLMATNEYRDAFNCPRMRQAGC